MNYSRKAHPIDDNADTSAAASVSDNLTSTLIVIRHFSGIAANTRHKITDCPQYYTLVSP